MNSKDRVIAGLTFRTPDRTPRDLWVLPYTSIYRAQEVDDFLRDYPIDFERVELSSNGRTDREARLSRAGTYVDEWGSIWQVSVPGTIGEVRKPVLEDWSRLSSFQPPWHLVRNRNLDLFNRQCDESKKFTLPPVSARPFERLQFLRGTENVYLDLGYGSKDFRSLLDLVHSFYLEEVRSLAASTVDGIFLMDDWGTQESMLISPSMWREIFKPLYRDYCDIIHGADKFVFFHTDGFVEPIFGDLIEIGMDAINSQLFCMDIEGLGERFRGKVTFWGEIDRQHVLPFGSREDVEAAVGRVRAALETPRGGIVAQCEWGKDNARDNIEAVFDAWP